MKKCLIVSGGEYAPAENPKEYEYVIACDRGYVNCLKMGVNPDVAIGDFDSYGGKIDGGIETVRLNPVKDDTDTISAVRLALSKGYKNITVCCSFGGRLDHSLANIQTAAFIIENGAIPEILGKGTAVYCVKDGEIYINRRENSYLSVFALSDKCRGVSISGTKYELDGAELKNTFPLGVSNEWTKNTARISVKEGILIIIISENIKVD